MRNLMKKFILLLLFFSNVAFAAPNHFSIAIGSALVCLDQVTAEHFNDYMKTNFGKPTFTAGEANWWKVDERLFNAEVQYVFVGVSQDFIGATLKDEPDKLIAKMRSYMGMDYKQMGAEKWITPTGGVIIKYYDKTTPSKMYCIGAPHTPNL